MITSWLKLSESQEKVGWKTIVHKTFMMPDGEPADYTTIGLPGAQNAAVIALTPDNRVVVARQFRAGPEAIFDELPGGGVEAGEDPALAAVRELCEETGYASDEPPVKLGTSCRDAYVNETNNYYLLRNCRSVGTPEPDDREFVEPTLISIETLLTNAKAGKMSDVPAVLMAYDRLMKLKEK